MTVAAIDIGTNSVRLLIVGDDGRELAREMTITRLGQGVDITGQLHPDAIVRTVSVLESYGALIKTHGANRIRAAATSAARDASNSELFFQAAERAIGARPELLPGEEEALLSFRGATKSLDATDGPFLVVDIGGGSTEFVLGSTSPEAAISVDMGCVRMSERHFRGDPPSSEEVENCAEDARRVLAPAKVKIPYEKARRMIGLAGTITSLGAMALGLKKYDAQKTHGMTLRTETVESLCNQLTRATIEQRRTMLAEPKRAEVIVGGAIVLRTILRELQIAELTVSEADILDGLAASLRD